jgi:hypothetical protein
MALYRDVNYYFLFKPWDSSANIVTGYGLDDQMIRVSFLLGIFIFSTMSRLALGPTQPQWVPGPLSLGVKRLGCEADHSPPSSAKVKECMEPYLHSSNTSPWYGA